MYTHEVGAKQVRYYWLRHTRGVNVGPFNQQSGIKGESAVDIDAELEVLNKKLSQNIVNEVIDTALPARNLEMTKTVTGLNVNKFIGYKQVYNTADGKLYTWNGSKYTENGVDVNGIRINTTQLVGTLQADQIGANTIGAGALQAGAVRAEHMAAGQVTADKLAIGLGGNLLYNPIFANNGNGWTLYVNTSQIANAGWSFNRNTGDHQGYSYLETENQFHWQAARTNSDISNVRFGGLYQDLKLVKGHYYCFSAYVGGHRSFQDLNIEQGAVQIIKKSWTGRGKNGGYGAGAGISSGVEEEHRIYMIFKANGNVNQNYRLIINQWAEGARQNPMMKIRRPMLEECTEHTREPSPWQNAGVTSIHGGSIITRTITTEQLAANSVTANEIATGAVTAKHVAANSIGANHVATRSLTADKLNVTSISSINANLGAITGGALKIGSLNGNFGTLFEVQSNGGFRLISRDASGGIELSSATRALHVWDGGTEVVKVGKLS